jgi:hypothetical protein
MPDHQSFRGNRSLASAYRKNRNNALALDVKLAQQLAIECLLVALSGH